jgi:hypothetical protein
LAFSATVISPKSREAEVDEESVRGGDVSPTEEEVLEKGAVDEAVKVEAAVEAVMVADAAAALENTDDCCCPKIDTPHVLALATPVGVAALATATGC